MEALQLNNSALPMLPRSIAQRLLVQLPLTQISLKRPSTTRARTTRSSTLRSSVNEASSLQFSLSQFSSAVADQIQFGMRSAQRALVTTQVVGEAGLKWFFGRGPLGPKQLREAFEKMGVTYIKLGQFIASSPTLFPEEYVLEFQQCLDNAPPIPFLEIQDIIEKELGDSLQNLFAEFESAPLATASIAQLHDATLHTGESVVVKVRKPGVEQVIRTDLGLLKRSAHLFERFLPALTMASLSDVFEELQSSMITECDFKQEAINIAEFRGVLESTANSNVTAPKVYPGLSTSSVLVMERLFGTSFADFTAMEASDHNPAESLASALQAWFSSLVLVKSFHADAHAGNLMMLHDGRVGFIDFGVVGRLSPATWAALSQLMQGIANRDYDQLAQAMLGLGATRTTIDAYALSREIKALYPSLETALKKRSGLADEGSASDQSTQEKPISLNRFAIELVSLAMRYGIRFPHEFTLLLKQLLYFDRYRQELGLSEETLIKGALGFSPF